MSSVSNVSSSDLVALMQQLAAQRMAQTQSQQAEQYSTDSAGTSSTSATTANGSNSSNAIFDGDPGLSQSIMAYLFNLQGVSDSTSASSTTADSTSSETGTSANSTIDQLCIDPNYTIGTLIVFCDPKRIV